MNLQEKKQSFDNLAKAIAGMQEIFKDLCLAVSDLQDRLERLERKPSIHTFHDGSQGNLPPNFTSAGGDD